MAISIKRESGSEENLFMDLASGMISGVVEFEYVRKRDGKRRIAQGTINRDFIPNCGLYEQRLYDPEGSIDIYNHALSEPFHYFDVEVNGIRSFIPDKLIRVNILNK